jgi:ribosomal protein S18 acetylase RimI-like enzyme
MLYQAIYVPEGQPLPDRTIVKQPDLAKYVRDWGRVHDSGFVAVEADIRQPVGAVWLRLFTGENRGYGYVDDTIPELSIAVLPEYRGQGVGTKLFTHLLQTAVGIYSAISLSVDKNNPALKLYERLGFEAVDAFGSSLVMKKTLN